MNPFRNHVVCVRCNHTKEVTTMTMGSSYSLLQKVCPNCGNASFKDVTRRWVSTSIWYKPRTWKTGYWEYPKTL